MQRHANIVEGFSINKSQVKVIFVDETLLQIDGQDYYWLWIAYEPNMDLCLMMHLSRERNIFVYVISSSKNYGRDLAERSFSQMVLDGIMMVLANG
jgi:hypothetical protein